MITSATTKGEKTRILQSLKALSEQSLGPQDREIKLLYVTVRALIRLCANDCAQMSFSQKKSARTLHFVRCCNDYIREANQVRIWLSTFLPGSSLAARIVIDEAHCVSQLGHDFRPDYKELHILRKILPTVPIMALSATCGPQVLNDLIKILGMKQPVDGNSKLFSILSILICSTSRSFSGATATGTIYFSSPLYRKNLHYKVVPKPDKAVDQIVAMKDYILEHHAHDTGIIYCFSIKVGCTIFVSRKPCR